MTDILERGQQVVFHELWVLQEQILNGKRPQYPLSTTTIKQLKASVAAHVGDFAAIDSHPRDPETDESQRKRRRIEKDLQEQSGKREVERSGSSKILDVDNVLIQAHSLIPPLSGLKIETAAGASSFDENDYYSSQVESEWSPEAKTKPFTADFEGFEAAAKPRVEAVGADELDDDYEPEEPLEDVEQTTPADDAASDYEPGEVSQDDDYTPEYAPAPADSPQVQVRNQLTHLAAPQPNRVSPLAVHKSYELELVNGRPEMVKKPPYETDARQSSASPPVKSKRKAKKRKREIEQPKPKKRDRRMGLDTSAQYPASDRRFSLDTSAQHTIIKEEPFSPQAYQRPQQQDLRRVASLQAHGQFLEQQAYPSAIPPPVYRQEPAQEDLYLPAPPQRVIMDQYGNRYYPAEEPVPAAVDRAPSRVSQYDPTNARIDYMQPAYRPAATPAYGQEMQAPNLRPQAQYEQVFAPQSMPPPAPLYLDRQPMRYAPAPTEYIPHEYAPRQGSVAPVQYHVRQAAPQIRPASAMPEPVQYRSFSMMPELQAPPQPYIMQSDPAFRYVDARGQEYQPRQITEFRQY